MKIYNLPLPDNQLKKSNDIKIFNYGKYEKIDRKITGWTSIGKIIKLINSIEKSFLVLLSSPVDTRIYFSFTFVFFHIAIKL